MSAALPYIITTLNGSFYKVPTAPTANQTLGVSADGTAWELRTAAWLDTGGSYTQNYIPYYNGTGLVDSPMWYDSNANQLWTGTNDTVIGNFLYFGNTTGGSYIYESSGVFAVTATEWRFNQPVYFDANGYTYISADGSGNLTFYLNASTSTYIASDTNGSVFVYGNGWGFSQTVYLQSYTLYLDNSNITYIQADSIGYVTFGGGGFWGVGGVPSGNYAFEVYGSIRASDMLVGSNVRTGEIALGNITGVQSALSSNSYHSYTATLTGNVTLSFDDAIADVTQSLIIVVTQNAVGSYTITWGGSNIHFPSGTAPAPVATALSKSLYEFKWAGGKWNLTNFIGGLA